MTLASLVIERWMQITEVISYYLFPYAVVIDRKIMHTGLSCVRGLVVQSPSAFSTCCPHQGAYSLRSKLPDAPPSAREDRGVGADIWPHYNLTRLPVKMIAYIPGNFNLRIINSFGPGNILAAPRTCSTRTVTNGYTKMSRSWATEIPGVTRGFDC